MSFKIGPDNIVYSPQNAKALGFADIVIERGADGGPYLTIDGVRLHALTQGITVSLPTRTEPPTVTVTFLAARVEMRDNELVAGEPQREPHVCPTGPPCCVCGKLTAYGYRNFRDQWFCWPCANGESPEAKADGANEQPADGG